MVALACAVGLLLLLRGPGLISVAWRNAGMLMLRDGILAHSRSVSGAEPRPDLLKADSATSQALQNLKRAVDLDSESLQSRWALGRAALTLGDTVTATDALGNLRDSVQLNPLLYQDVLIALSYAGQPEEVIALYESFPPAQHTQVISDTLALAYLELSLTSNGPDNAETMVRALNLRPVDLSINYYLWRAAIKAEDVVSAASYNDALLYFPLEAVHPTNERLLDYVARIVPDLLAAGMWDRERVLNVVSYLTWQHNEAPGVEQLLKQLIQVDPEELLWPFYLAETHHRRGDFEEAAEAYRQLLGRDSNYAPAFLRLGIVAEARSKTLGAESQSYLMEAASWYDRYHEMAPGDFLGLKQLVAVCAALEEAGTEDQNCHKAALRVSSSEPQSAPLASNTQPATTPAAVLEQALQTRADDRRLVADLLGIPPENVELGPNLVENGGFEEQRGESPSRWVWRPLVGGDPRRDATFAGGDDAWLSFEGQGAVRVEGLWVQPQEGKQPAIAGFWHWDDAERRLQSIRLRTSGPYLFSLYYRTMDVSQGEARILVSHSPDVLWTDFYSLPDTAGTWRRFVAIGWNRTGAEAAIHPLVSSSAQGSVVFDAVQLRRVQLPIGTEMEAGEARLWVIEADD